MRGATVLGLVWLTLGLGCRTPPLSPVDTPDDAETRAARATLGRFAAAVKAHDFVQAERLLAAPLRARYTPQTLARDFELDPLGQTRLENAWLALQKPAAVTARKPLQYPLANGGSVRFEREGPELKLAALE